VRCRLGGGVGGVAIMCALSARASEAQTAAIEGSVFDSVRGAALAGAMVVLEGTPNAVRADSAGRFLLEGIPAGSAVLSVESDALDSLGISIAPVRVELRASERRALALATPSAATIIAAVCAAGDVAADEGVLSGIVRDVRTRAPAGGARIDVTWDVWVAQGTALQKRHTGVAVRSAENGAYVACGVPADALVHILVRSGSRASGDAELRVGASRIARADLSVGGAGESSVRGRVLAVDGTPLGGARVGFAGDSGAAASDSQGNFRIDRAPSGTHALIARRLGFAESQLTAELPSGSSGDVVIRMLPAPHRLAAVTTVARAGSPAADAAGFAARRERGNGHFVDRKQIAQAGSVEFPELLRGIPGFVVHFSTFGSTALWTRPMYLRESCTPHYFVDGLQLEEEQLPRSNDVESLEAYAPGLAPARYGGAMATCAVVVAWTRHDTAPATADRSAPDSAAAPP